MALVDYSSDESSGQNDQNLTDGQPPSKRRKDESSTSTRSTLNTPKPELPPLPPAFHDLYASTVRQSVVDDPSLHQGRKRQNPHVRGNWPSHLYIEWHPSQSQHEDLSCLLNDVEAELDGSVELHRFLKSDLGAPLPLHISLSRPISLPGGHKVDFLDEVSNAIRKSAVVAFKLSPNGLAWFRSPDSNRTFLVLRVESSSSEKKGPPNPELMALLSRCNAVARHFNQPSLYQQALEDEAGTAFHVSVAWTFGLIGENTSLKALELLETEKWRKIHSWELEVSGVKTKIGNVVSHIPLGERGSDGFASRSAHQLF